MPDAGTYMGEFESLEKALAFADLMAGDRPIILPPIRTNVFAVRFIHKGTAHQQFVTAAEYAEAYRLPHVVIALDEKEGRCHVWSVK